MSVLYKTHGPSPAAPYPLRSLHLLSIMPGQEHCRFPGDGRPLSRCATLEHKILFSSVSLTQILEELPNLTDQEREELLERLLESKAFSWLPRKTPSLPLLFCRSKWPRIGSGTFALTELIASSTCRRSPVSLPVFRNCTSSRTNSSKPSKIVSTFSITRKHRSLSHGCIGFWFAGPWKGSQDPATQESERTCTIYHRSAKRAGNTF